MYESFWGEFMMKNLVSSQPPPSGQMMIVNTKTGQMRPVNIKPSALKPPDQNGFGPNRYYYMDLFPDLYCKSKHSSCFRQNTQACQFNCLFRHEVPEVHPRSLNCRLSKTLTSLTKESKNLQSFPHAQN